MIELIKDLDKNARIAGLEMNIGKTKILAKNKRNNITINSQIIENMDSIEYLGQLISIEKRFDKEIERRIALRWTKFWTLKNILKRNFKPKHKCEIFNSCVHPTLLYGTQTWSVSKKDENKLTTTQNSMERAMLNYKITARIPLSKIKRKLKYNRNVIHCINRLKWDWAG